MNHTLHRLLAASAALVAATASAQGTPPATAPHAAPAKAAAAESAAALVQVEGGWVRATVTGQQATGAFMKITAREPLQLVGVRTPVAGDAEVHEMKMEGNVMHMRPAGPIALQPGQPLELKSGGYHLMLTGLHKPLPSGAQVPLTLVFRDARGAERTLALQLPVAVLPPAASQPR